MPRGFLSQFSCFHFDPFQLLSIAKPTAVGVLVRTSSCICGNLFLGLELLNCQIITL